MVKSVMTAYVLWAFGGPVGLHHLYLGRDSHALLWIITLGGFGLGWIREAIRIPAYVDEANQEADNRRKQPPDKFLPPASPFRFIGQVCVGIYFGTVALIGLNTFNFFYLIVLPLSIGAGVHLVSSVGQQTSDLNKTLITCILTSTVFYGNTFSPLPISLAASITASQNRKFKPHRRTQETRKLGPRLLRLGLALVAFSAPLGYCIFHNTTASLYYLSDCVTALLDIFWFLPWLRNVLEYFLLMPYHILCAITGGGYYEEAWKKMWEIILKEYSEKEKEALRMLLLDTEASFAEITRRYRELAKKWHPDHNPSQEAEAMFIKIQQAFETLQRKHRPRPFK